jgi:dCTP deaminase
LVLGITKEKITLPEDICGWLNSRSRFARIGLMSHITAPFISPGVSNRQILEIFNAGKNKIKLMPGTKICQLVLQECKGKAKYEGKFKEQTL